MCVCKSYMGNSVVSNASSTKDGPLKCPCMDPEMGQEWVRLKVRNTVKKTARKRVRPKEELH